MEKNPSRVVLITGASSGFGQASAEHLSRRGYRVYGTSRNEKKEDGSERTVDGNSSFRMIPMDIREDVSVQKGAEIIFSQEDRLDVVINNAGYAVAGSVEECPLEEVKDQIETNLFGTWRVCQAVLPQLRKQGFGTIINISSVAGLIALPFQAAYCANKFAVEALTETLRMEVRPFGIQVCLVEPGDFKTNLTENRIKAGQFCQDSAYHENFNKALRVMEHSEIHGPRPDKLAVLIEHIINDPNPRLRYTTGLMSQPNFLFIMADQMAAPALPIYGHPVVQTPHLSNLAENGVVFDNAYCNSPLCAPSRFSMLAGQLPSRIGAYDNAAYFPAQVPTFAHYLRDLGYHTCLCGKMHMVGPDQLHGFEERLTTDIYPADFGWTPDWENFENRPSWYHNMLSVVQAGTCRASNQIEFDEDVAHHSMRNHLDLNVLERTARFPSPEIPDPDGTDIP